MEEPNPVRSVQDIFEETYREKWWGRSKSGFNSGPGSGKDFAQPYAALIREIVSSFAVPSEIATAVPVRFVDLGCGDFRVARMFVSEAMDYVGIDVVPGLIDHNQRTFGSDRIKFRHLDIIDEAWPAGEICAIRQVMQHLSNADIGKIVRQFQRYQVVVITEHVPCDSLNPRPNLDIDHGAHTRLYQTSGVYLDQPPFSLEHLELRLTLKFGSEENEIRTWVIDRRMTA